MRLLLLLGSYHWMMFWVTTEMKLSEMVGGVPALASPRQRAAATTSKTARIPARFSQQPSHHMQQLERDAVTARVRHIKSMAAVAAQSLADQKSRTSYLYTLSELQYNPHNLCIRPLHRVKNVYRQWKAVSADLEFHDL